MEPQRSEAVCRVASMEELGQIAGFWEAMLIECDLVRNPLVPDWRLRFLAEHTQRLRSGSARWFVAEATLGLVGSAYAYCDAGIQEAPVGKIAGVYVVPEWRRRGLARRLTQECLEWLRAQGCATISLQASPQGRPLYESLGFTTGNEMRLDLSR
ncbi:MAG: GNAT family N-acetyltransferase [Candidatus Eremiobacteraeota bacterium]|nr:GNAT family N-acetyltransferase [Candidatus Eremiobacteraeota bacterium]